MMKAKWILLVLVFAAAFVVFFNERFISRKAITYLAKHTFLETRLSNSTSFPYVTATVQAITKSVLSTTEHSLPQYMTESIKKIYAQSWDKVITPYITQYVIDGQDNCNVSPPPSVLIFVLSLPKNTMERQAIRHTWGSVLNQSRPVFNISAKIVFMLGMMVDETKFDKVLQEESTEYKDIVQFNLMESRNNLTKKMINGLRWIKTYCGSVKYILKTDDDTFINLERFSNYLLTNPNINNRTIHGYLYGDGGEVLRVGKYAVKKEELPSSFYPPYVSGTAYILPFDLISDMLDLVERLPYCPVDDAFMTGVLRVILDIKIQHSGNFTHVSETKLSPCQFSSKMAVTNINIKCMDMLWNLTTRAGGVDCKQSTFYDKQICPIFG